MLMVNMNRIFFIYLAFFASFLVSESADTINCQNGKPEVFFITPQNGYKSTQSEIKIIFGIKNLNIVPAGINSCDSGHHHLVVDAELPILSRPIPSSKNYIHFGKGQTETTIELSPGKHTLQLLVGNFAHIPHADPIYSKKIEIEVVNSQ